MPSQELEPVKWPERSWVPVVAQRQAAGYVGVGAAPAVDDRVVDRLQRGEAVAGLGRVRPRLGAGVVHHPERHTQPSVLVQAVVASVPQRWFGPSGMTVPSCGRGRRRPGLVVGPTTPRAGAAAELVCR